MKRGRGFLFICSLNPTGTRAPRVNRELARMAVTGGSAKSRVGRCVPQADAGLHQGQRFT